MARLLLELIVLVLLVSLVSCQVITSHSKSDDDSISASSITLGNSKDFKSSTSSISSSDSSLDSSDLSKYEISEGESDSSSSISSETSIIPDSSSSTSDSYSVEQFPFEIYDLDNFLIENGCEFLTEFIIKPNTDLKTLDELKQIPTLTNCSNVDDSIMAYQLFSFTVRNLCPTNETSMTKSIFRQVISLLNNSFGREIYYKSKVEGCENLFHTAFYYIFDFSEELDKFKNNLN